MLKKIVATTMLFLSFSSVSWALGGKQGDIEVGPYAGYGFLDDYKTNHPKRNLLYGIRLGYFIDDNVSFEPSYQILFTDTKRAVGTNNSVQIRSLRFNLLYNFLPEHAVRPFITGGLGWEQTRIESTFRSNDLGVNAGLGLRWLITDNFAARLDGRYIYSEINKLGDDREHNYEGTLGFTYLFGGNSYTDSDGDGVADKKDECPNTPKGATVDVKGCPSDADGDGVFDGIDQCPNSAKGMKVDEKGCTLDSDADGIPDSVDQCANTPAGTAVDEKGCPKDSDGDGVVDGADQCPDTPKGVVVNASGCPLDSDGDGVTDDKDQCPNTPKETKIDEKGCPIVNKARGVLKGVNFKSGSAELLPTSFKTLDEAATALQEFPNVKVEVQGHTDNTGKEPTNQKLSQARAETVAKYLADHGVSADRMVSKGYGSSKPIAPNKTKAGRGKNRRVELNWLD